MPVRPSLLWILWNNKMGFKKKYGAAGYVVIHLRKDRLLLR
jgi:hypothetical protein